MATVAAAVSASPPSQFAALLRRSKFASYDPRITQIYTTSGGDAHRGNWGLKRALPLRKRSAHISISAVDTRQQQTVWERAGTQARFVKMWDEVGVHPKAPESGPWRSKLGPVISRDWYADTEFARKEEGAEVWRKRDATTSRFGRQSESYLDELAMSDKQFEAYLERLRKLRPAFYEYLQEIAAELPGSFESLWRKSAENGQLHKNFLARLAYDFYNSPDSRAIEQQPEPSAGLSYNKVSTLQSLLFKKAHNGRVVVHSALSKEGVAGFAGVAAYLPAEFKHSVERERIQWEALAKHGSADVDAAVGEYRMVDATLESPPEVVGRASASEAMKRMKITASIMESGLQRTKENVYRPGSREYVGAVPSVSKAQRSSVLNPDLIAKRQPSKASDIANMATMDTLSKLLKTSPDGQKHGTS
ncbi:hypothetical protein EIP86_004059 [Pleurotus ostreatoroseus]|nr:hypothetical protein EIP86_004059 [Pleurotus ostreatoroseus]